MALVTRKPTGVQSTPIVLLAGVQGGGKTWAAIEASTIPWVNRCFVIEVGESTADAYGAIPGADFEIVEYDGTLGGLRGAIRAAANEPAPDGTSNMLVVDSLTEVWDLIKENIYAAMADRLRRKNRQVGEGEIKPDMDLWNRAADISDAIMRDLLLFPGPVLVTARLDEVTSMDDNNRPTRGTDYKIQTNKKVPYRVHHIVEARSPRMWTLTKTQTVNPNLAIQPGEVKTLPGFTISAFFEALGVGPGMVSTAPIELRADGSLNDQPAQPQNRRGNRQQQAQPQQAPPKLTEEKINEYSSKLLEMEQAGQVDKLLEFEQWCIKRQEPVLLERVRKVLTRMGVNNQ